MPDAIGSPRDGLKQVGVGGSRLTFEVRLALVLGAIVVVSLGTGVATSRSLAAAGAAAERARVAASAEALITRYLNAAILSGSDGRVGAPAPSLAAIASRFERTHAALLDGGVTALGLDEGEDVVLAGAVGGDVRQQLDRMAMRWKRLAALGVVLATTTEPAAVRREGERAAAAEQATLEAASLISGTFARSAAAHRGAARASLITGLLLIVAGLLVGAYLVRRAVRPGLDACLAAGRAMADGDLSVRADAVAGHELGRLRTDLDRAREGFAHLIHGVLAETVAIRSRAEILARDLPGSSDRDLASTVTSAARDLSTSIDSVAVGTRDMSERVRAVAAGVLEIDGRLTEISQNASRAGEVAGRAVVLLRSSADRLHELDASTEIFHDLAAAVDDIAAEAKVLALNATISAARSGDDGAGLAAFADEMRELAARTTTASATLRTRLAERHDSAAEAMRGLDELGGFVTLINQTSRTIEEAARDQGASTRQVSESVSLATSIAAEITGRLDAGIRASGEVERALATLDQAAKSSANGLDLSRSSGAELLGSSEHLEGLVRGFKVG